MNFYIVSNIRCDSIFHKNDKSVIKNKRFTNNFLGKLKNNKLLYIKDQTSLYFNT